MCVYMHIYIYIYIYTRRGVPVFKFAVNQKFFFWETYFERALYPKRANYHFLFLVINTTLYRSKLRKCLLLKYSFVTGILKQYIMLK